MALRDLNLNKLLYSHEDINIKIENRTINYSRSQTLLGVLLDKKLKFDKHIEKICQKSNRKKLNAPARVTNYIELPKRCILMNAFLKLNSIIAQLFHSRSLNNKMNRLHELCLCIIYNGKR